MNRIYLFTALFSCAFFCSCFESEDPTEKMISLGQQAETIENELERIKYHQTELGFEIQAKTKSAPWAAATILAELTPKISIIPTGNPMKKGEGNLFAIGTLGALMYENMYPGTLNQVRTEIEPEITVMKANKTRYSLLEEDLKTIHFELYDMARKHPELQQLQPKLKMALEGKYGISLPN